MANLLQSSQTKTTCAPGWFNEYLSGLASAGKEAQQGAKYVGAQPLQEKAFQRMCETAGATQPMYGQGAGLVGQAGSADVTGAANPYLETAAGICSAQLAQQYMNPFINTAVQSMSDIAQRNIQQNLSPQATAASVGSGQYGSQRGAQVLGQVRANAEQDLNNQIAQMLTSGYGQALTAAGQKQTLLGNLGATAGCIAARQANIRKDAGTAMADIATKQATQNIACINAQATLGGQQQTIEQNRELFPLSTLSNYASLLQGYQIPVGTKTTLCMSPLSAVGTLASTVGGVLQKPAGGGCSLWCTISKKVGSWLGGSSGTSSGGNACYNPMEGLVWCDSKGEWVKGARGGLVSTTGIGCTSTRYRGALPQE